MPKKILLADDSVTIQKVVELTFMEGDYEVTSVSNGKAAVEQIKNNRPDILLCDVIMPEMNGYEVTSFVKKDPTYSSIPVILLTGTFEPFDEEKAKESGADTFVTKPFDSKMLVDKVDELLSQRMVYVESDTPEEAQVFQSRQEFTIQSSKPEDTPEETHKETIEETPFLDAPEEIQENFQKTTQSAMEDTATSRDSGPKPFNEGIGVQEPAEEEVQADAFAQDNDSLAVSAETIPDAPSEDEGFEAIDLGSMGTGDEIPNDGLEGIIETEDNAPSEEEIIIPPEDESTFSQEVESQEEPEAVSEDAFSLNSASPVEGDTSFSEPDQETAPTFQETTESEPAFEEQQETTGIDAGEEEPYTVTSEASVEESPFVETPPEPVDETGMSETFEESIPEAPPEEPESDDDEAPPMVEPSYEGPYDDEDAHDSGPSLPMHLQDPDVTPSAEQKLSEQPAPVFTEEPQIEEAGTDEPVMQEEEPVSEQSQPQETETITEEQTFEETPVEPEPEASQEDFTEPVSEEPEQITTEEQQPETEEKEEQVGVPVMQEEPDLAQEPSAFNSNQPEQEDVEESAFSEENDSGEEVQASEIEEPLDEHPEEESSIATSDQESNEIPIDKEELRVLIEKTINEYLEANLGEIVDKALKDALPELITPVAWEVIPELAETIIKKRIKELESEAE